MYYSKTTFGFYDEGVHKNQIPKDAVKISDEYYNELIEGQANGRKITPDENGKPILTGEPVITPEYQIKRAFEYPDFREYLDGIVKGDQQQIQSYIDACLAVKEKYPKP